MCQGKIFGVSLAMEEDSTVPDFRDIEVKLGRKVPESLARSITHRAKPVESNRAQNHCTSSELKQLESKMLFLKQEMVSFFSPSSSFYLINASSRFSTHRTQVLNLDLCSPNQHYSHVVIIAHVM